MSLWWIFFPVAVAGLSLLFIDGRGWRRPLGFALFFGGIVGLVAFAAVYVTAEAEQRARCVSIGGTPNAGDCWRDGQRVDLTTVTPPGGQS